MGNLGQLTTALLRMQSNEASLEDLRLLTEFIQQSGQALKDEKLSLSQQRWSRKMFALLEGVAKISEPLEVATILGQTAHHFLSLFECSAVLISLSNPTSGLFEYGTWLDSERSSVPAFAQHPDALLATFGQLIQPRQVLLSKPGLSPAEEEYLVRVGYGGLLMVPLLVSQNQPVGMVQLFVRAVDSPFIQEEIAIGQMLARHAAIAIQHARLYESFRHRAEMLEVVREASLKVTASLQLLEVLDEILKGVFKALPGIQDAHVFLYQNQVLSFGAALWASGEKKRAWSEPRQNGLTYTVARTGKMIIVDDYATHPLFQNVHANWSGSIVSLPLLVGQRVVGVMNVAHGERYAFKDTDLVVLNLLADQAAIAIINARLHEMIVQQARTDALTGLHNRRAFDEKIEEEIRRTNRYGHPFSLIMLDINKLKVVNDQYGHLAGDTLLVKVARRLGDQLRNTDFLCRYGGDEFAIVLPETSHAEALEISWRLARENHALPYQIRENLVFQSSFSLGVSTYPEHGQTPEGFIELADAALYAAKNMPSGSGVCSANTLPETPKITR